MSSRAMTWAWEQPVKGNTLVVLLRLCDWANGQDQACDVSLNQLCKNCKIAKGTVRSALDDLVQGGFIRKERQTRNNGGHAKNRYSIQIDVQSADEHNENMDGDPRSEIDQGARSKTDQALGQSGCPRLGQTVDQGKELIGNVVTPLNPPKGGNPVDELIEGYEPDDALVEDLDRQGYGPVAFIWWVLPRWKRVAKAKDHRNIRPASNFTRWLTRHRDLDGLKEKWKTETIEPVEQEPKEIIKPEALKELAAGRYALKNHVGAAYLVACEAEGRWLDVAIVDDLIAKRDDRQKNPKDDIAAHSAETSAQREIAFTDKWLKGAAA